MYINPNEHSDHDLLQLTEEELLKLPAGVVRRLLIKLLYDLKEARERLQQTSRNSSRPPSSDLPWDKTDSNDEDQHQQQEQDDGDLKQDAAKAYTTFETVDLEWADPTNPGIRLTNEELAKPIKASWHVARTAKKEK